MKKALSLAIPLLFVVTLLLSKLTNLSGNNNLSDTQIVNLQALATETILLCDMWCIPYTTAYCMDCDICDVHPGFTHSTFPASWCEKDPE